MYKIKYNTIKKDISLNYVIRQKKVTRKYFQTLKILDKSRY